MTTTIAVVIDTSEGSQRLPVVGLPASESFTRPQISSSAIDLGEVEEGSTASETVSVTNNTENPITFVLIGYSGNGAVAVESGCTTLLPGAVCDIDVSYSPSAVEELAQGNIELALDFVREKGAYREIPFTGRSVSGEAGVDELLMFDFIGAARIGPEGRVLRFTGAFDAAKPANATSIEGLLAFDPAIARVAAGPFSLLTRLELESSNTVLDRLDNGVFELKTEVQVKVPEVRLDFFGFPLRLSAGDDCRAASPVELRLASKDAVSFDVAEGGRLYGNYRIEALQDCGLLTSVLSKLLKTEDQPIRIDFARITPD